MSPRFTIDLLRTGQVGETWQDWFVGPHGGRHLVLSASTLALVFVVGAFMFILQPYWRLSGDLGTIPSLQRELANTNADLAVLKSNLQALGAEAKRQIRWSDLLNTFSEHTPPGVKLHRVELAQPSGTAATDSTLTIEALTRLRAGSEPLVQVAQLMANIMRDPAVSRRFQLANWEVKPEGTTGSDGVALLGIRVTLTERPQ